MTDAEKKFKERVQPLMEIFKPRKDPLPSLSKRVFEQNVLTRENSVGAKTLPLKIRLLLASSSRLVVKKQIIL